MSRSSCARPVPSPNAVRWLPRAALAIAAAAIGGCNSSLPATADFGVYQDGSVCATGLLNCAGSCIDPSNDPKNCGKCGSACLATELCSNASCAPSCGGGTTQCSSLCVNLQTDLKNCGVCGTACKAGEVCSAGTCALACQSDLNECKGTCVNQLTDVANCGGCGIACKAGEVCSAGKCALSCQTGLIDCNGTCVDPKTSNAFCGATGDCQGANAGSTCAAGQLCSAGTCALSCQTGLINCNSTCVDPKTSGTFCGATSDCQGANAGSTCAAGQLCSAGTCALSCQTGLIDCNGTCVDPKTSGTFCGATGDCQGANAGSTCAAGQLCSAGTCALSCQTGLIDCNSTCVDPKTSGTFCGATGDCQGANAGSTCAAGQLCSAGTCALSCQTGLIDCNSTCVDPKTSNTFCGATSDCQGANAGSPCAPGQLCSAGTCALSCQTGLINCNGTCTDPKTSNTFCGATSDCQGANAGSPCAPGQLCSAGKCALSCQTGLINCNGTCTDPKTSTTFCGATGNCQGANAGVTCATGLCASGACKAVVVPNGANVVIAPATPQAVSVGTGASFTVTPAPGYAVLPAIGGTCPAGAWAATVYTTGPLTTSCSVIFNSQKVWAVTPSGTNVTITPSTPQIVVPGATVSLTVKGIQLPNGQFVGKIAVGGTCPAGSWTTWTAGYPASGVYQTGAITADCTVTFNGTSCPYVASWNGSTYVVDNDIYSTARYPGGAYRDYLKMKRLPVLAGSQYKLQIIELENESSWTDDVQLDVIDHAPGVDVSTDMNGNIVSYAKPTPPAAAQSGSGADVLPVLAASALDLYDGDSVLLSFPNVTAGSPATLVLKAMGFMGTNIGSDFPHPPAIDLQTLAAGQWVTRATFKPRVDWSTQAYDLRAHLGSSSQVRLVSSSCNKGKFTRVGFVGLDAVGGGPVTVTALSPISAQHSSQGNVLSSLLAADGVSATMTTGEDIKLAFTAPPLAPWLVRDFVFVAQGYYIPAP